MTVIKLGNGDIGVKPIVSKENNEISIEFSQLNDVYKVDEAIECDDYCPICKLKFDNIGGLESLINILYSLREKIYKESYFKLP